MPDFFISYNTADEGWATWIAYILEEEGFTTVVQAVRDELRAPHAESRR